MDDRLLYFFWLVGSAAYFGILGAGFGALAGSLSHGDGRPTGTGIARRVARNFERVKSRGFTSQGLGSLIGAVDGFLFLGSVGLAVGWVGYHFHFGAVQILVIILFTLLLIGLALFFGSIGYLASKGGVAGVGILFLMILLMGTIGFYRHQMEGLMMGVVGGMALGVLLWRGASRQRFQQVDRESQQSEEPLE